MSCERFTADCFAALGNQTAALECRRGHLALARERGDAVEEQRALTGLGTTLMDLHHAGDGDGDTLAQALEAQKQSLSLARELPHVGAADRKDMEWRCLFNMGSVYVPRRLPCALAMPGPGC